MEEYEELKDVEDSSEDDDESQDETESESEEELAIRRPRSSNIGRKK